MNKKITVGSVIGILILVFFVFLQIFPFYLSLVWSFQPKSFRQTSSLNLWPESFNFQNYVLAWKESDLLRGFLWSLIYSGSFTFISMVIALVCGYIFGKKNFHGKNILFFVFMSALMVPGEILLVANYILITELGLYGSPIAVVITGLVNIFGLFLFKQFMHTIPDSILESAVIDGAKEITIIGKIVLPMSMPIVATYCIMTFTGQWNEYLWPQLVLNSVSPYDSVQIKLILFRPVIDGAMNHPYAYTLRMAATMIALLPVIAFYFAFQKYFVSGISVTGLK